MTVLIWERLPLEATATDRLASLIAPYIAKMRSAPGALWVSALEDEEDHAFVIASEWRTDTDAEAFEKGAEAAAFAEAADVLLSGDPTRRRFTAETSGSSNPT